MPNKTPWGPEHPSYPNCPVPPGTDCTVWFRDGAVDRDTDPDGWSWFQTGSDSDIIAYTDHSAPDAIAEIRDQLGPKFKHLAAAVAEELRQNGAPDQARELLAEALEALNYLPYRNERSKTCAARIDAYLKGAL